VFIGVLAIFEWFGGLTGFGVDGGNPEWWTVGLGVARVKAIWSLRLRLHSGLRQSGEGLFCDAGPKASP
jgi:hypothetical protein